MTATSDPETAVREYIRAFNNGDIEAMASCFASSAVILDGMAPHVWHGPAAARDWYRDVLIEGEHEGAADYFVSLAEPRHANVTGDSAYAVFPATMSFRVRGKQIVQSGATFTTALRRIDGEWRLVAWAWAKGTPQIG
jgi:ketosteroid isomerase-like protein